MNSSEMALLLSCHRATLNVLIDGQTFRVRVRPSRVNGETVILAMLLNPELAFVYESNHYSDDEPIATNPGITLLRRTQEPPPATRGRLDKMFAEIGMVFVTPQDAHRK